jgi:hypothetical protein
MTHPSDDDLILRFYGEHAPAERSRIDAHLAECATCQAAWEEIGQTLKLVDVAMVPEPPDGFERVMWARVARALPPRRHPWTWRALVPAASLGAVVVAVLLGTPSWRPAEPGPDDTAASTDAEEQATRERALFAALDGHFDQTEMLLTELMNAPEPGGDFEFEQTTADELVASGRLYKATAEQTGHRALAAMLEDLEPVLVEVARSPAQVDRATVQSLRERIDDDGLLFKVRAVSTDQRDR